MNDECLLIDTSIPGYHIWDDKDMDVEDIDHECLLMNTSIPGHHSWDDEDVDDKDMDDECLLINTSIPGYHISLAYLPALNYSCDMDIRPISIYFMDHNSQN